MSNRQRIFDAQAHVLARVFRVAVAVRVPEGGIEAIRRAYVRAVRRANAIYWANWRPSDVVPTDSSGDTP